MAAGRLHDVLNLQFPTFLDTGIERGASISERIKRNLHEARIFLAVIGKGWMKTRKSLSREDDWVRREILMALEARPAKRVIPDIAARAPERTVALRETLLVIVYAAIGQKASSIAQVIEAVRRYGAPERCLFVVGEANAKPGNG